MFYQHFFGYRIIKTIHVVFGYKIQIIVLTNDKKLSWNTNILRKIQSIGDS